LRNAEIQIVLEGAGAMTEHDQRLDLPLATQIQSVISNVTRCYSVIARCRNDIWRVQAAALSDTLHLNDQIRDAWVGSDSVQHTITAQQPWILAYAQKLQQHTQQAWQLWLEACGSLSGGLLPLADTEVPAAALVALSAAPAVTEGTTRARVSNTDGQGEPSRAGAA
jgi:hypothetical protein